MSDRSSHDAVHAVAVDIAIAIGDVEKPLADTAPLRAKAVLADPGAGMVVIADDAHGMAADAYLVGVVFLEFIDLIGAVGRPVAQALIVEEQRHHGRSLRV